MIGTDSSHFQVVAGAVAGERDVDEQTLSSLAVLAERLERLQKLDKVFSKIEFSTAVRELQRRKDRVAIG
jgi:hypothetical protein